MATAETDRERRRQSRTVKNWDTHRNTKTDGERQKSRHTQCDREMQREAESG